MTTATHEPATSTVELVCPRCRGAGPGHALDAALRCPGCGTEHGSVQVDDGPRVVVLLEPDEATSGSAATARILARLDAGSVEAPGDDDAAYVSALATFG